MRTPTIFIPHGSPYDPDASFGLRGFLQKINAFGGIGREASPIYTGITVTRSGSGTRSWSRGGLTVTQNINYSGSHTFDRFYLVDQSLQFGAQNQYSDGSVDEFLFPDSELPPPEGYVNPIGKTSFIHYVFGINRGVPSSAIFLADPKKHFLKIAGSFGVDNVNYGTQTASYSGGSTTTTDIVSSLAINCPFFSYNNPSAIPLPNEYDQWNCRMGIDFNAIGFEGGGGVSDSFGLDVTGYSATKWRNLRGTYTLTVNDSDIVNSWDSNSLVHTTEWTIF